MVDFNDYGETDSIRWSIGTLSIIGASTLLFLFVWDVPSLLEKTGRSLISESSLLALTLWRVGCLVAGISAVVYMLRMKTGHMIVRSHEKKEDVLIHPLGINKFVTFSSWTLMLNVFYFSFATISSLFVLTDSDLPSWLSQLLACIFVTSLGASFLTSTVVRYVILPGDYSDEEHHKRQFWFHNQMMHNFCTIFLVAEILLTTPRLEVVYMLFGILTGLLYATFAFPFAIFGGGYYCYPFIDPRLQKAPLYITILALGISLSYVGVWLVSELISFNFILGGLFLIAWCSMIVQFSPKSQENR
jgi:hypothetical protein